MATGVYTTTTNGTPYTWRSKPDMAWNSAVCVERMWVNAYQSISISLYAEESISVSDKCFFNLGLNPQESIAFNEVLSKSSLVFWEEAFYVSSSNALVAGYFRSFQSDISIVDTSTDFDIGQNIDESISFAEEGSMDYDMQKEESFSVSDADVIGSTVAYNRTFSESLTVTDAHSVVFKIYISESLSIREAWWRAADMVVSDITLMSPDSIDDKAFENLVAYGSKPGYTPWRNFIPGDYEYQNAMFRVLMTSKNEDRGLIRNLQVTVDVPDLLDRGTAYVTVASYGAAVTFSRHFHIVPEVTTSARGGTTTNPIVVEFDDVPTKTGFRARLRDTVTGAYTTGSFSWAATGY